MSPVSKHIFLADDDEDDRLLFKDAVEELKLPVLITTLNDGEQLMKCLSHVDTNLPDAVFLDLNMPRKNGFTCLNEIKSSQALSAIPVIIFSTSYQPGIVELLYEQGAHYYIPKPADFGELKKVIHQTFALLQETSLRPSKEKFLIKKPNPRS